MRILITSGGTSEYIDGVRVVTNLSTGSTGALLADRFAAAGHEVHLLKGRFAADPDRSVLVHGYTDFGSLESSLRELLSAQRFDGVIHLAAVSDFSPEMIIYADGTESPVSGEGKLSSSESFSIRFRRNHKIIDRLRSFSEGPIVLVGYKLTNTTNEDEQNAAVAGLIRRGHCDLVVHNDLHGIGAGLHRAVYHTPTGCVGVTKTKEEMAHRLLEYLGERI